MKLQSLIQMAGGFVLALAVAACAGEGSQQPMIIAATDVQVEPAADQPETGADATEEAPPPVTEVSTEATSEAAGEEAVAALPPEPTVAASGTVGDSEAAPAADAANTADEPPAAAAAQPDATDAAADRTQAPEGAEAASVAGGAIQEGVAPDEAAPALEDSAPAPEDSVPAAEDPAPVPEDSAPAPAEEAAAVTADAKEATVTVAVAAATPSAFVESYRLAAHFEIVSSTADGVVEDVDIRADGAWQRADNAFGFDASFRLESIDNGATQIIEYVMLGDHVALRGDGGWTTSPRGAELPIGEPVAMLDVPFAGALSLGAEIGAEEIAGVPTIHYRIDDAEEFGTLVADAFGGRAGTLTSIALDSWLAEDGYVVQYLLSATTTGATTLDNAGADQRVDQTIAVEYTMSDIGAVSEIAWPPDAPPADALVVPGFAANAFPLPVDAQLQPSVGLVAFDTALDEAAVRDFYAEQLGAAGWSLEGEYGYYTARSADMSLVLAVTTGADGQPTRVEIFAEPKE